MLTAQEARKISEANKPDTTEALNKIMDKIKEAAEQGLYFIELNCRDAPGEVFTTLIKLGYYMRHSEGVIYTLSWP